MRYLANTSFIQTQTVTDTSPALRVKDICLSHKWTAGTSSEGALSPYDMMSTMLRPNVDTVTASGNMVEANSIYLGKRWREWNEDGHKDLWIRLEEAANLAELTLENCCSTTVDYTHNIEKELMMKDDLLIELMRTARRAILRCNADSVQDNRAHKQTLKRLNDALYQMTKHNGYNLS